MDKISVLTMALTYIEKQLSEPITPNIVAEACHYSLSGLQKIFSQVFKMGIADYISRRRITAAARDLLMTRETVLDIAFRYGFSSHEVFIRVFKRIWGETPNRFRKTRSFAEVFPPYTIFRGGDDMPVRQFDTTRLYDAIRRMDGTYAIIFDTVMLSLVNESFGSAAGDMVIAECLRRIDLKKRDDMLMFRIGGDEYILLTGLNDISEVNAIASDILSMNGGCISCGTTDIPVEMRCAVTMLNASAGTDNGNEFRRLVSEHE